MKSRARWTPRTCSLLERCQQVGRAYEQTKRQPSSTEVSGLHRLRVAKILDEHRFDCGHERGVGDERGDFKVEPERPVVEVCCADSCERVIDDERLGVQKPRLVAEELNPRFE